MASLPTQRTLNYLRKQGAKVQVVEKWISQARRRVDLFGCIDIVALHEGHICGYQACTRAHVSVRLEKALAIPELKDWLSHGGLFFVIGWGKSGPRGEVKRWKPHIVEVTLDSFE